MAVAGPPGACDQLPVPTVGTFAAMVAVPGLMQAVKSGPAAAVVGKASTVTIVEEDGADVQPRLVTVTVYAPAVVTVMDWVVSPVDHKLPIGEDEVRTTLPPIQNVVGPPALIVGVGGIGFTVTVVPADGADEQPATVTVTVYVPAVETLIDCVVAPVDHKLSVADDEVKVTLPPVQKVVGPPGVIVGVGGIGLTVPDTATFTVVTPLDATVILPDGVPVADAAMRTYIMVFGTEPPDCVNVSEELNPLPLVIEISKSVGAVIVISAVNALPETVKFCSAEGEPLQLLNAASGVPVTLIEGAKAAK